MREAGQRRRLRGVRLLPREEVALLVGHERALRLGQRVADAVERGARLLCGGRRLEGRAWAYPATVIADACMLSDVIDCDVYETPLTFDDGKGATARREGGAGDHRGHAHAPAYERPRGSM